MRRRDKHGQTHLVQELQVYQVIIGTALRYEGFTRIDPLVPVWSRAHDTASQSRKVATE